MTSSFPTLTGSAEMARTFSAGNNLVHAAAVLTAVPLTMACWFKPVDATTVGILMSLDNNVGPSNDFRMVKIGTTGVISAVVNNGSGIASSTVGCSAGVWQHACAVYASATDRRAFLNGGSKGTNVTNTTPSGIIRTRLGLRPGPSGEYEGDMAEAAIWSVALSDVEVALLATGICPASLRPEDLVAYWPILGQESPEPSAVGSFAMTLTGTPAAAAHPFVYYSKNRFARRGLLR